MCVKRQGGSIWKISLILNKGQSSSRLLQPVCCQIGALQLPTGSGESPADAASRA